MRVWVVTIHCMSMVIGLGQVVVEDVNNNLLTEKGGDHHHNHRHVIGETMMMTYHHQDHSRGREDNKNEILMMRMTKAIMTGLGDSKEKVESGKEDLVAAGEEKIGPTMMNRNRLLDQNVPLGKTSLI